MRVNVIKTKVVQRGEHGEIDLPSEFNKTPIEQLFMINNKFVDAGKPPTPLHFFEDMEWVLDADLAKINSLEEIKKFAKQVRQIITKNADSVEVSGWPDKAAIAQRVVDKIATDEEKQSLTIEADKRGRSETVLKLAKKQLARAVKFRMARAWIDGLQSKAESIIEATETEDLEKVTKQLLTAAENEFNKLLKGAK